MTRRTIHITKMLEETMKRGSVPRSRAPTADELGGRGRQRRHDRQEAPATHRQLQLVNLSLTTLDTVRRFSDARHLVILDLHSNFLNDISGLSGCTNLVQLDLSKNQLTTVPPAPFWQKFNRLRILYLHDNAIAGENGSAHAVESLSKCPKLQVLTLHHNPLAIIRGYRVYVINMIWSLLALDHHIIADCEVVEGMVRVGTFAPCTDRYARNCYNRLVGDFDADYVKMCCLLANIYAQQRKNSPIQVVQRAIRSQKTQRPPRLPEPTQPPEDTNWARDEPLDTQNPAASPDPLNMQEPTVKIEVDRQKLVNQVHATFQGFESHPRSEYLDWVKLNVLDSHHRGDRTTRKEAKPLSAKGAPLRMPSFESTADNRRRPSCRSLPPPVSLEHSQDKTAGPAAPPLQKADLARIQSDVERPLSSRDVSRGPMEKSNFLRPLITAESQRGRAARERAGQARQKRRAMAVRRDVERAATVVIDHKTAVYLAAMTERRKDEDVIRQHAQAVRAAEEQLRTDHAAWRQYELQRHADLDKERTLLRAQLTALAKKEKTELVTQFRQQLSQTQRAKTFLAKTQREALERMRREVHAALREKRQQNVHQNTMEANQLQQMRAKLTTADAQQRKALASKTKAAKLPPGAAREAVTHSAKSRDHPYLQGLPAVPARPAVVAHQTPMTLYAEPGVGAQIKAGPLAAEAYPQSMWPTMPTHMLIDARLRELEGRWQSIGDFCQLEKCRLNPVHACGDCFPKFRAFVTVEITDAISGAAAAAAVTSS